MPIDGPSNSEISKNSKDLKPAKESVPKSTHHEFVAHMTAKYERADEAYNNVVIDGAEVPFGTSSEILFKRKWESHEQLRMLNNLLEGRASDLKDQINPEPPSFWEMSDSEKKLFIEQVVDTPLADSVDWYEEVIDYLEGEYDKKYGGRSLREMMFEEEEEAKDDIDALKKMRDFLSEMVLFLPPLPAAPKTS